MHMDTMLGFVGLVITTLVALFAALALQTLLLRAAFALMQPATASRRVPQPAVEHGTQLVARAFSTARWFGEKLPAHDLRPALRAGPQPRRE
jgi:hypothetical protein